MGEENGKILAWQDLDDNKLVCHQPELAKGSHILLWVRKPTFFSFLFIVLVFGFLT